MLVWVGVAVLVGASVGDATAVRVATGDGVSVTGCGTIGVAVMGVGGIELHWHEIARIMRRTISTLVMVCIIPNLTVAGQ